jgi:ribosomal protein L37AE/L43A
MDILVRAGVGLLFLVFMAALVFAAQRQSRLQRAASIAASRRRRLVCRYCGEPAPSAEPGDGWTCVSCGYDVDASGKPFFDPSEGKKRRFLKAVAEAEERPAKKKPRATSEQVQAASPPSKMGDERYQGTDHERIRADQ